MQLFRFLVLGAALTGVIGLASGADSRSAVILIPIATILSFVALVVWLLPEPDPWRLPSENDLKLKRRP